MAMGRFNDNNHSIGLLWPPVVAGSDVSQERTADQPTKHTVNETGLDGGKAGDTRLWRADVYSEGGKPRELDSGRNSTIHTEGVLSDDGTRNSINQHFENIRAKIQRAAQRFCGLTNSFTSDVRSHLEGILKNISPSRQLEQTIGPLEQVIDKNLTINQGMARSMGR